MKHSSTPPLATLSLPLLLTFGCASHQADTDADTEGEAKPRREFEKVMVEGEPMFTVLPPDGIPAISEPEFATAAEGDEFMDSSEPVLGVVGRDGTARAYSAWQLDGHEIVNDVLDGEAIAATW